jgi:hypothetical protein
MSVTESFAFKFALFQNRRHRHINVFTNFTMSAMFQLFDVTKFLSVRGASQMFRKPSEFSGTAAVDKNMNTGSAGAGAKEEDETEADHNKFEMPAQSKDHLFFSLMPSADEDEERPSRRGGGMTMAKQRKRAYTPEQRRALEERERERIQSVKRAEFAAKTRDLSIRGYEAKRFNDPNTGMFQRQMSYVLGG